MKRFQDTSPVHEGGESITISIGRDAWGAAVTDVLLETAIANWEPRFTANGVDASDYARITRQLERWDDWCSAWCAGADVYMALGSEALHEGRTRSASEFYSRAATYYHFGKFMFVHDQDQARAAHARAVDARQCS
jgi:2,6-dihydroxypseudooxynicotine hydrolase